jgi:hypothetical protein
MATRFLVFLAVFAAALGLIYWFVTYEAVGAVLLLAFACMPAIVAFYAIRHGAMRDRRSEDDSEADPRTQAGEVLGPFPAETVWPVFLVLGTITIGASLIYGLILLPLGAVVFVWAIVGFTRESRG